MPSTNNEPWAWVRQLHQANEEIASLGNIPALSVGRERWLRRHLSVWPWDSFDFIWTRARPVPRKIHLLPLESDPLPEFWVIDPARKRGSLGRCLN